MLSSPEDECDSWNTHTSPKTSTPLRGSPMWAIHRTEGLHKKLGHGDRAHTLVEEERDRKIPILSAAKKKKKKPESDVASCCCVRGWAVETGGSESRAPFADGETIPCLPQSSSQRSMGTQAQHRTH